MISIQLRQALLNLMWEGGYQVLAAGKQVERETFDLMQRLVRAEPLEGEPPVVILPPVTGDPLDGFRARKAQAGDWGGWCRDFLTPAELSALTDIFGSAAHEHSAYYDVGGIGNVKGIRASTGALLFAKGEIFASAAGGAADEYIAAIARAQGKEPTGGLG
jgi:hypothetical protein